MRSFLVIGLMAAAGIVLVGCGKSTGGAASTDGKGNVAANTAGDDHSGWWCTEHGVPEEECARCDSAVAAKLKAAGDWCEEHNRPESQCFLCSPARFDKFAARYEIKFGTKPPKPTE
jgi:hypothetical protein